MATDSKLVGVVRRDSISTAEEGTEMDVRISKRGELLVCDFWTEMALEGRCFQVRLGTVTTPVTGDEAITDTAAEMAADAQSGVTIMPFSLWITLDAQGGDALEIAGKSVATVSSAGDAFVPLPLYSGGNAATSTARADEAGSTTVTAELATTTLRHFAASAEFVQDAGTETLGMANPVIWEPRVPPVLNGPRCFYVQAASATTGPVFFAHFDDLELRTTDIN